MTLITPCGCMETSGPYQLFLSSFPISSLHQIAIISNNEIVGIPLVKYLLSDILL